MDFELIEGMPAEFAELMYDDVIDMEAGTPCWCIIWSRTCLYQQGSAWDTGVLDHTRCCNNYISYTPHARTLESHYYWTCGYYAPHKNAVVAGRWFHYERWCQCWAR